MKTCPKCGESLPIDAFGRKGLRRQTYCKPCQNTHSRAYYAANKPAQKARALARNKRYGQELRDLVKSIKESDPCLDCGVFYPWYVMDFDHVRGTKEKEISQMVSDRAAKQKILDEIAKCELVCSNCHRARTFARKAEKMDVI